MAVHNTSTFFPAASSESNASLLHSKAIWSFTLILAFVLTKLLGGKKKLPEGSRPLPALKGKEQIYMGNHDGQF